MTLKSAFKTFYGVSLEAGSKGAIIAHGIERLPDYKRKELEEWLEKYKEHALERLNKEK